MSTASNGAAIGPRSTETKEETKVARQAPALGSDRPVKGKPRLLGSRLSRSTLQDYRTASASGHPVEKSVQQSAAKYNLSPELIRGVIRAESNFQVNAVSSAGAKGLMQLMPETAKELGVTNPFDIQQNIDGGARYLRQMLDRFGGDLKRALAAYNAGPGAVEQFNGDVPFTETRQYVQRVLRYAGLKA
jgi:soluble lytic murein transglycosylase-like protein